MIPKLERALFKMKLDTKGYSRVLILNSIIVFLHFVPKIAFLGKFGPETSKCFNENENPHKEVFRGANSEFDNFFLKFHP